MKCLVRVLGSLVAAVVACGAGTPPGDADSAGLHGAIARGDRAAWRRLLGEGADLGARDAAGNTPLHLAALHGQADCVRALLDGGADANATNGAAATPVIYGVMDAGIVRVLLDHGADPNAVSKRGMTPLLAAVRRGESYEVARMLVEAGADVNAPLEGSWLGGPLFRAIEGGDPRTIGLLLDRGAVVNPTRSQISPLQLAAMGGDLATVKRLVAAGADINYAYEAVDSPGHALSWALWSEHPDIAAYLIDRGADLNLTPATGNRTPPMVWAGFGQFGDPALARRMIARGLDVNTANASGETALFYALKAGPDTELVRYLRGAGAEDPGVPARDKAIPRRAMPPAGEDRNRAIRESAQRAIDLMQHSSEAFLRRRQDQCVSCHHQFLPPLAYRMGRERGLQVDELALGHQMAVQTGAATAERVDGMLELKSAGFGGYRGLVALEAMGYSPNAFALSMVRYVRETQNHEGTWSTFGRPPLEESSAFPETAWAVRAIRLFPRPGEEALAERSVQRAMAWMRRETPATLNQRTSQLLGLAWGGEPARRLRKHVRALLEEQRPDGGWAQLPTLESDAWATGQTLYALFEAGGLSTSDPAYQRGVEFLLRTQFEDGSWWVRNRTWPFQPHFDSQFPHGRDQWISIAGTAWATMALLATLEPLLPPVDVPTGQALVARWKEAETAGGSAAGIRQAPLAGARVDFRRDIQPLLERSCLKCHEGGKPKGGFSLASRHGLLHGGQSQLPAVSPGDGRGSAMVRFASDQVEDMEMPPLARRGEYPALTAEEIRRVVRWINQGAEWPEGLALGGAGSDAR